MSSRYVIGTTLALLWLLVGVVYVWAAWLQKDRVNLSASAGGQYPYLVCADAIAKEGSSKIFGDRNRMPLYPALLSSVHDDNWDAFVDKSAWFAIASSVVVLIGVGILSYLTLSVWLASALTLATVVCVFIYNASFVQAELTYYGLLFASWLLLCRVLLRPHPGWAVLSGVAVGLTYLTKGAALPIIPAFLVPMGLKIVALAWARRRSFVEHAHLPERPRPMTALVSAFAVVLAFLIVVYPYIRDNKARSMRGASAAK